MSDGLVAFLRARLDETEAAAKGTFRSIFLAEGFHVISPGGTTGDPPMPVADVIDQATAEHIALHDPARELRKVTADRAILAGTGSENGRAHEPVSIRRLGDPPSWPDAMCDGCNERWPCGIVRLLAAVYRDHPDWRQEWAP